MTHVIMKVPPGWKHPRDCEDGSYIPLFPSDWRKARAWWLEQKKRWDEGFVFDSDLSWIEKPAQYQQADFVWWAGRRPRQENAMPEWDAATASCFQVYKINVRNHQGFQVSPVLRTMEDLEAWLQTNLPEVPMTVFTN